MTISFYLFEKIMIDFCRRRCLNGLTVIIIYIFSSPAAIFFFLFLFVFLFYFLFSFFFCFSFFFIFFFLFMHCKICICIICILRPSFHGVLFDFFAFLLILFIIVFDLNHQKPKGNLHFFVERVRDVFYNFIFKRVYLISHMSVQQTMISPCLSVCLSFLKRTHFILLNKFINML